MALTSDHVMDHGRADDDRPNQSLVQILQDGERRAERRRREGRAERKRLAQRVSKRVVQERERERHGRADAHEREEHIHAQKIESRIQTTLTDEKDEPEISHGKERLLPLMQEDVPKRRAVGQAEKEWSKETS